MKNIFILLEDKFASNKLFKEELLIFYKNGLITKEQYEKIIKNKNEVE